MVSRPGGHWRGRGLLRASGPGSQGPALHRGTVSGVICRDVALVPQGSQAVLCIRVVGRMAEDADLSRAAVEPYHLALEAQVVPCAAYSSCRGSCGVIGYG